MWPQQMEQAISESFPPQRRRLELALIYAAGVAIAVAFVLMALSGHVRAQLAQPPDGVPFIAVIHNGVLSVVRPDAENCR